MSRATLFDKLWQSHVIDDLAGGWALLHVDRLLLHDLNFSGAHRELEKRGVKPISPELVFAVPDHAVSSAPGRTGQTSVAGIKLYNDLRRAAAATGVTLFDIGSGRQGIVHVIGPETGLFLPGLSIAVGDSHTCTNGAIGALAIGVGSSEGAHVLATQTVRLQKPRNMRIRLEGELGAGVTPKDAALHIIRTLGTAAGMGCAIEFAGSAIRGMAVEGRLTVCNLAVEMGARFGIIAVDEKTIEYVRGKPYAPTGAALDSAIASWRELHSDGDAVFDVDVAVDAGAVVPTITWGTNPEQAIAIDESMPLLDSIADPGKRASAHAAFDYMGLEPGRAIAGTPVQWVFIGSCNNSRMSDLEAAAGVVRGRHVAAGVSAWVVPGSEAVKLEAEAAGLDKVFLDAGFEWREPGCSLCAASNGEQVPPQARCVSTSNRNFVGRQGPRARTHLASPAMAAAAAIAGAIVDVRTF
jgi:3-isopropylmalate/(R)-2-methylmalate dehydratase large subunit